MREFQKYEVSSMELILQKTLGYYENKDVNTEDEIKSGNFTLRVIKVLKQQEERL